MQLIEKRRVHFHEIQNTNDHEFMYEIEAISDKGSFTVLYDTHFQVLDYGHKYLPENVIEKCKERYLKDVTNDVFCSMLTDAILHIQNLNSTEKLARFIELDDVIFNA